MKGNIGADIVLYALFVHKFKLFPFFPVLRAQNVQKGFLFFYLFFIAFHDLNAPLSESNSVPSSSHYYFSKINSGLSAALFSSKSSLICSGVKYLNHVLENHHSKPPSVEVHSFSNYETYIKLMVWVDWRWNWADIKFILWLLNYLHLAELYFAIAVFHISIESSESLNQFLLYAWAFRVLQIWFWQMTILQQSLLWVLSSWFWWLFYWTFIFNMHFLLNDFRQLIWFSECYSISLIV